MINKTNVRSSINYFTLPYTSWNLTISVSFKIEPISNEIKKLLEDKKFLDEILLDGVEKANIIASKKIERIKEIVGF